MWLFLLIVQLDAETTQVDTTKTLPFLLQDLAGWFEKFTPRQDPRIDNDGWFADLAHPAKYLGAKIDEEGFVGRVRSARFRGFEPAIMTLDGILLEDPVFGASDLDQLPVDIVRTIALGRPAINTSPSVGMLNLTTKKNISPTPWSQLRFLSGSYGASKLGLDYSRHLSRRLGCYLSFNQLENLSYRAQSTTNHSSFFGSLYGLVGVPMNATFYSAGNGRTLPDYYWQDKDLTGGSVMAGDSSFVLTGSYFNNNYQRYSIGAGADTLHHRVHSLRLQGETVFDLELFCINFGASGQYNILRSNYLPEADWLGSLVWSGITVDIGRLGIEPRIGVDAQDFTNLQFLPGLALRYAVMESTYLRSGFERSVDRPGYISTAFDSATLGSYRMKGNPGLAPEVFNTATLGLQHRWGNITGYGARVLDRIVERPDSRGYSMPTNSAPADYYGISGYAAISPVRGLDFFYSGNYRFQDSADYSYLGVRYRYDLTHVSFLAGYEKEWNQQHIHHGQIGLRFIDFHFFLRVENFLNDQTPGIRPRSALLGGFWNFSD